MIAPIVLLGEKNRDYTWREQHGPTHMKISLKWSNDLRKFDWKQMDILHGVCNVAKHVAISKTQQYIVF